MGVMNLKRVNEGFITYGSEYGELIRSASGRLNHPAADVLRYLAFRTYDISEHLKELPPRYWCGGWEQVAREALGFNVKAPSAKGNTLRAIRDLRAQGILIVMAEGRPGVNAAYQLCLYDRYDQVVLEAILDLKPWIH